MSNKLQRLFIYASIMLTLIFALYVIHLCVLRSSSTDIDKIDVNKVIRVECKLDNFENIAPECGRFISTTAYDTEFSYAIIRPKNKNTSTHFNDSQPVVYIDGGPGTGNLLSVENLDFWNSFYPQAQLNRPLIILNPIGVKGSYPVPSCPAFDNVFRKNLTSKTKAYVAKEHEYNFTALSECIHATPDISHYSSYHQAQLILQLLHSLGYKKWHVWGSSYGARVALLAAKNKDVLSLVIDSPYVFSFGTMAHTAKIYIQALNLHVKKYRSKNTDASMQTFAQLLDTTIEEVNKHHISVAVSNRMLLPSLVTKDFNLLLSEQRMLALAFFSLYDDSYTSMFYELLETILTSVSKDGSYLDAYSYRGSSSNAKRILIKPTKLIDLFLQAHTHTDFNTLTHYLIECNDNELSEWDDVLSTIKTQRQNSTYGMLKDERLSMLSLIDITEKLLKDAYGFDLCSQPVFKNRKPVNNENYPEKPMFAVVGEYDPVTPVNAINVIQKNAFTHRYIAPDMGHGILFSGFCSPKLVGSFLANFDSFNEGFVQKFCPNLLRSK